PTVILHYSFGKSAPIPTSCWSRTSADQAGFRFTANAGREAIERRDHTLARCAFVLMICTDDSDRPYRRNSGSEGLQYRARIRRAKIACCERRLASDAAAFANAAPIGWPAILFVGVDDKGTLQQGADKLENLAKAVPDVREQAYPAIYRQVVPMRLAEGGCLP